MGFVFLKKERLFGFKGEPLANTVLFMALLAIYQAFLRLVNSGRRDQDLVKTFKQNLFEKIYLNFVMAKKSDLSAFTKFWNDGKGIFVVSQDHIDIRI